MIAATVNLFDFFYDKDNIKAMTPKYKVVLSTVAFFF